MGAQPIILTVEQATNPKTYRQAQAEARRTGRTLEVAQPDDPPLFVLALGRASRSTLGPITLSREQALDVKTYRQARDEALHTGRALAIRGGLA